MTQADPGSSSAGTDPFDRLARFGTPTIANALELLGCDPADGFTGAELALHGGQGPFVGRALTATMRSAQPSAPGEGSVATEDYWRYLAGHAGPTVAVVQDLDPEPVGAMFGEVQGRLHRALGVKGVVCSGAVRDVVELAAFDFPILASRTCVSHAHARFSAVDVPVRIAGLEIHPGDVLHADRHGVQRIPSEVDLERLAALAALIEDRERELFTAADDLASIDGFLATWHEVRSRWPTGDTPAGDSL